MIEIRALYITFILRSIYLSPKPHTCQLFTPKCGSPILTYSDFLSTCSHHFLKLTQLITITTVTCNFGFISYFIHGCDRIVEAMVEKHLTLARPYVVVLSPISPGSYNIQQIEVTIRQLTQA